MKMKHQYWLKLEYDCGKICWELTKGKFASKHAAARAYEARGKALHFTILELKPHEQFYFNYDEKN